MSTAAAGWYPDPAGSGELRYWNGSAWTSHLTGGGSDADASTDGPSGSAEPTADQPEPETPGAGDVAEADWARFAKGDAPPPGWGAGPTPTAPPMPTPAMPPVAAWPGASSPSGVPVDPRIRFGPDGQVLSGWWRRFGGYMIDTIAISFVTVVIVVIYGAVTGSFSQLFDESAFNELVQRIEADPGYQPSTDEVLATLGSDFLPLLVFSFAVYLLLSFLNGVLLVASSGQTIGDRVVKTRKVVAGRRPPALPAALLRWLIPTTLNLLGNLPLIGIAAFAAWLLDYLWPLWDDKRQTWHDKAAHTFVERADLAGPLASAGGRSGAEGDLGN